MPRSQDIDRHVGNRVAKSDRAQNDRTSRGPRAPRWARVCAIVGCVLMVVSGAVLITGQALIARYAGSVQNKNLFGEPAAGSPKQKVSDIKGPLNILLVGIDPRDSHTAPLSDSIIVVHVPE